MARAQTVKKKGRSSSSAKPAKGRKTSGRPAAQRKRPTQKGMVGSKGKGRNAGRDQGGPGDADGQRTWIGQDIGTPPARESTRGPEPNGRQGETRGDGAGQAGRDGREARSRRAGLGFRDEE